MPLYQEVKNGLSNLNTDTIPASRKAVLQPLITVLKEKIARDEAIRLNFICTHNSRRSHLAQVWAQTWACFYNLKAVTCYSAGTDSTAVYPVVVRTLAKQGFSIMQLSKGSNPIYSIKYAPNEPPIMAFSKILDHPYNPLSEFIAVMTCDSASQVCPIVVGAEHRIAIPYKDPKAFDATAQQAKKYLERSLEIATELKYVFSNINIKP